MTLSTHVLDTATGLPRAGVPVRVYTPAAAEGDTDSDRAARGWALVGAAETDADGRVRSLVPAGAWRAGRWRLEFDTAGSFYPRVTIEVVVADDGHCHVPLLLSPYGYTTYRGS